MSVADSEYSPKEKKRKRKFWTSENLLGLTFACIPLVGFCLFTLVPALIAFAAQFTSMDGFDLSTMEWNNFNSFKTAFEDPLFWRSFGIDLFFVACQFASLLIALITAAILAQLPKAGKIFTTIFFVPQICSSVAIVLMSQNLFDYDFGIINTVLVKLFGADAKVNWLNEEGPYLAIMFFVTIWQGPGYGILIYKAAFTNVNANLYEAADLDGANRMQKFLHITLPAISPTTFFLVTAGLNAGMQMFDIPHILSGGGDNWLGEIGPGNIGLTTTAYIYRSGISVYDPTRGMPVAAVMSYSLFVVMLIISIVNFKMQNKWVSYD